MSSKKAKKEVLRNRLSQIICPLCGTKDSVSLVFYKNKIPILKCINCGTGNAIPVLFDSISYYNSLYFNGGRKDGYSDYLKACDVLRSQFRRDIALLHRLGARGGSLLEIGCAYGFFLDEAKNTFQVGGIELCEDAVANCNARGYKDVHHGELSKQALARFPEADVVVMMDVIEHISDPVGALEAVVGKLKPGGLLLITTGDFSSLSARISGCHWRLMTPPQHLWFFTPRSLNALSDRLGLELIHHDYPWKKVPFGLILHQLCRYIPIHISIPNWANRIGIPVNLFDAMRLVFRKRSKV